MSGSVQQQNTAVPFLASDLIGLALRNIGVGAMGTTPGPQDIADAIMSLNMMLGQWQQRRWLVPNLVDRCFMSTGASVYSIGPGGDLNLATRPTQVISAYARLAQAGFVATNDGGFTPQFAEGQFDTANDALATSMPIDYQLTPIQSYENYASIALKGLKTFPSAYHYNPAFPNGELRVWPIPQQGLWEIHLLIPEVLSNNLTASTQLNLPPEYMEAIVWNLACRLAPAYGQEASPTAIALARTALNTIQVANTQIPTLAIPGAISPYRGGNRVVTSPGAFIL